MGPKGKNTTLTQEGVKSLEIGQGLQESERNERNGIGKRLGEVYGVQVSEISMYESENEPSLGL